MTMRILAVVGDGMATQQKEVIIYQYTFETMPDIWLIECISFLGQEIRCCCQREKRRKKFQSGSVTERIYFAFRMENDGGIWYYLTGSGAMAVDTWIDSYYINASGAWVQ